MTMRKLFAGAGIFLAVVAIACWWVAHMSLLPEIGDDAATRAIHAARRALEGGDSKAELDALTAPQRGLPVVLTVYVEGQVAARGVGRGDTVGSALRDAIAQLHTDAATLAHGRLKLDRVIGRGFLSSRLAPLLAIGAVPGRDGIGVEEGGKLALLTAEDLTRARLWSGYQPLPFMEFQLGIDVQRAIHALRDALDEGPRWRPPHLFRFRAEEWVERADHGAAAQAIVAGHPSGPALSREALLDGARAGGDYLLHHLSADGRFDYEYYTMEDSRVNAGYSIPRHAGAASFLAQLYAVDHDQKVRAGVELALDALVAFRPPRCSRIQPRVCVGEVGDSIVDLGSSALALVAAAEYERSTGDRRYDTFMRGLAEFLLSMQKADGDYCHLFNLDTLVADKKTQLLYYSGEAAYALARLLALHHTDEAALTARAVTALDRGLDYLTDGGYASFTSHFYIGEDHWTCMAIDTGWDFLPPEHREKYAKFCADFADFLRRSQMRPGESLTEAQPQLTGAYGITALLAPHTTPVGSRSETTISMWHVAKKRGLPDTDPRVREPREQVLDGMRFLLQRQIRPDLDGAGGDYLTRDPEASRGGIPMSDVERHVRVDFIQHSCSAMLRAVEML